MTKQSRNVARRASTGTGAKVPAELVKVVEREVAAWFRGAWRKKDHSLEALTRRLLREARKFAC